MENQKTKEGILAGLENKSRTEYLYEELEKAEQKFFESLKELRNFDEECDCEEPKEATSTEEGDEHYGNPVVAVTRCLVCGGLINEEI